jgi:hypothetical protein
MTKEMSIEKGENELGKVAAKTEQWEFIEKLQTPESIAHLYKEVEQQEIVDDNDSE